MARRPVRGLVTRPSVSVVIPCYRYGRYLPAAVAAALDQPGVDVEVVVVDDASPDDSAEVAARLAAADPRVRLVRHETNRGHIATYNDGLAAARGDYLTLVSADDLLTPGALSRAAALMEHHPRVGLVYGWAQSFAGEPPTVPDGQRSWSVWSGRQWLGHAARTGRCVISSPEAVMRREAFAATDGYDPRLPHSGDFDMWLRTAARWDVARVNGAVQALYRVHEANMHLTTYAGWLTDLRERRRTFEILLEERAHDVAWVQDLRPTAYRALAREAVRRALRALRDGRTAEVRPLLEYAAETSPDVAGGPRWRAADAWARRGLAVPGGAPWRFAERLDTHLRWRRERRWGT